MTVHFTASSVPICKSSLYSLYMTQTTKHRQLSQNRPLPPPLLHIHARESPYGCSQHFLDEDARPPEPHRKLSCYQRGREGLCLQLQYHSPAEDKKTQLGFLGKSKPW